MARLAPYPFAALITRMFREWDRNESIFDLPGRKFFLGDAARDFSVRFHGHSAGSPLGPAAGPQTQMAQNIVLSWLGGSRIFELKTVQIRDDLVIPRPCIDMRTVGFNVEWSQELRLEESLEEYVKGSMLVEILQASGRLEMIPNFRPLVYDLSVGYDLAGIRSERVSGFIRGMLDAREVIERLRGQIPREFRQFRDLDFSARLSDTLTLSTFHGCPSDEIERIIDFLLREHRLHCVIKFNPMLLGPAETRGLLHDVLGYRSLRVPDSAFERDTRWDQAVAIVGRLRETAHSLGLGLGVKCSNTLIVENAGEFLPTSEKEVYLSGPPLHVLAVHLVRRFRRQFGASIPISFAAGIDRVNFPDAVAMGLVPVTTCSDLLKPGGYGRLQGYHAELARRMEAVGAATIDEFILRAYGQTSTPHDEVSEMAPEGISDLPPEGFPEAGLDPVAEAALRNTEHYVERATADPRYAAIKNVRLPRKIGRSLQLFDCISCDKCVPVCPNDANFSFCTEEREIPIVKLRRRDGRWEWLREGSVTLAEERQYATFADFCNECGNCDVFCPEDGGPYLIKPRFFGSESDWRQSRQHDEFFVQRQGDRDIILGRFRAGEFRLEIAEGWHTFAASDFEIRYRLSDPEGTIEGDGPEEVDLTYCQIMDCLRRGVLRSEPMNYVAALQEINPL